MWWLGPWHTQWSWQVCPGMCWGKQPGCGCIIFRKWLSHLITYSSGDCNTQISYWMIQRPPASDGLQDHPLGQHYLTTQIFSPWFIPPIVPTTTKEHIKWWKLPRNETQLMDIMLSAQLETHGKSYCENPGKSKRNHRCDNTRVMFCGQANLVVEWGCAMHSEI